MRGRGAALGFVLAWSLSGPAGAAESVAMAPPGASACSGCHGTASHPARLLPAIWGRPPAEIAGILADYRAGKRDGTVMPRIAKGFTEDESRAIAAWLTQP